MCGYISEEQEEYQKLKTSLYKEILSQIGSVSKLPLMFFM